MKRKALDGAMEDSSDRDANGKQQQKRARRDFDFSRQPRRKIAIRFLYHGWLYDGLVQQANTDNTVEKHLLDALVKTRLVEDRERCEFTRCGRTDRGVSAFKQVAAFVVRSGTADDSAWWPEESTEVTKQSFKNKEDLPYLRMLNGVLPSSIRVTAWTTVPRNFTARHACSSRTYKYALPRASYNLEKLRAACLLLKGKQDFRNFCQIDMNEARVSMSYVREIFDIRIDPVERPSSPSSSGFLLLELTVRGSGFLWHMIRFIVGVLHEIGVGNEEPELISRLLNVDATPRRPVYSMATDGPLCLFDCEFDEETVKWQTAEKLVAEKNLSALQKEWAQAATRARMLENMISAMSEESPEMDAEKGLLEYVVGHGKQTTYIPFVKRPTCESLEEKRKKLEGKVVIE